MPSGSLRSPASRPARKSFTGWPTRRTGALPISLANRSAPIPVPWTSSISPPEKWWRVSRSRPSRRASRSCNGPPSQPGTEHPMVYEVNTTMDGREVLQRAKRFFAERVPLNAAYPEREGPSYLTLRGQGGEEIVFAVWETPAGTRIRASTLFFDQVVDRFLSTLPLPAEHVA